MFTQAPPGVPVTNMRQLLGFAPKCESSMVSSGQTFDHMKNGNKGSRPVQTAFPSLYGWSQELRIAKYDCQLRCKSCKENEKMRRAKTRKVNQENMTYNTSIVTKLPTQAVCTHTLICLYVCIFVSFSLYLFTIVSLYLCMSTYYPFISLCISNYENQGGQRLILAEEYEGW